MISQQAQSLCDSFLQIRNPQNINKEKKKQSSQYFLPIQQIGNIRIQQNQFKYLRNLLVQISIITISFSPNFITISLSNFSGPMAKFFMPKQNHQRDKTNPRADSKASRNQNNKSKPKKKNYRLEIFEEMMALLRLKHMKYVSVVVKQLKQLREEHKEQNDQKIMEKQGVLKQLKVIKKKSMKSISVFLMKSILKIDPTNILDHEAESQKKIIQKEQQSAEDNDEIQEERVSLSEEEEIFMKRVIASNMYKKKLEAIGTLLDIVQRKKSLTKQKNKERKMKKLMKKANKNQSVQQEIFNMENEQQNSQKEDEQQSLDDEARLKKIYERLQNKNKQTEEEKGTSLASKKLTVKTKKMNSEKNNNEEEIKKERTKFIKKGRNKVKQEKKNRKFQNRMKHKQEPEERARKQDQKKGDNLNRTKHPSWQAKQELNKKMFISDKFEGKKIIL